MKKGKSAPSAQRRAERRERMKAALVAYRLMGATPEQMARAKSANNIGQINWRIV
jgi:hypothetical protein